MLCWQQLTAFEGAVRMRVAVYRRQMVRDAYLAVVDGLTAALCDGRPSVVRVPGMRKAIVPWTREGRNRVVAAFDRIAGERGITGEPFEHLFVQRAIACAACPFGRDRIVIDARTGLVRTSSGKRADDLDPTPVLTFFERRVSPKTQRGLTRENLVRLLGPLEPLALQGGLKIRIEAQHAGAANERARVHVSFPHGIFGDGTDWVLVSAAGARGTPLPARPPS